jgi:hypothetical protein
MRVFVGAIEAAETLGHDWGEAPQVGVQNILRKLEKFRPAPPDEVGIQSGMLDHYIMIGAKHSKSALEASETLIHARRLDSKTIITAHRRGRATEWMWWM